MTLSIESQAAVSLRKFIGPKSVVEVWGRFIGSEWILFVAIDPNTSYSAFDVPGEWRGFKVQKTYWVEPTG